MCLNISLKDITSEGLFLAVACFSVSIIFKQVAINRAMLTGIYTKAKKKTDNRLKTYADGGFLIRVDEYCEDYEKKALERDRKRILDAVGVDYTVYKTTYLARSIWYLCKKHKALSFKQVWAISKANRVKRVSYNPDFLRTTIRVRKSASPSEVNNTDRKNAIDTLKTFVFSIIGGAYAISIAQNLVVSFSVAALVAAGIKFAIIIMTSAFRAAFGWNLITITEVNRLDLQATEAFACVKWSMEHYPNDFQGKTIPMDDSDNDER